MDSIQGSFISCGPGIVSFSFTCSGSDCEVLSTFPNVTCYDSSDGTTTVCSNGIHCSSPPTYSSNFTMSQTGGLVSIQKTVDLGDCGAYTYATNGSVFDNSTSITRQSSGTCKLNKQSSSGTSRTSSSEKTLFVTIYFLLLTALFIHPTWALQLTEVESLSLNPVDISPHLNLPRAFEPKICGT
jgi:hypothetical protein